MDIEFIGSGPAAKAILYYITDYISKSQLKTHVAYATLKLAIKKLGEYDPSKDLVTICAKQLLQKCAHAMISHQEMSGQFVATYLLDLDDHFTSHIYRRLYWTSYEAHIEAELPSPECYVKEASTGVSAEEVPPEDPSGDREPELEAAAGITRSADKDIQPI